MFFFTKTYNKKLKYLIIIVFVFFLNKNFLFACDLVLHDWQLRFYHKIYIDSFIPLSEISILENHFKTAVTDKIIWLTKPGIFSSMINIALFSLESWVCNAKWYIVPDNKLLKVLLSKLELDEKKPIIIGSDNNFLKICLFSDVNSNDRCYQLVIAQNNRIRCVFQDSQNPWAQEFKGQSCFSLVFYDQVRFDSIISCNIYPINNGYKTLYENVDLVEQLLNQNKLKARPSLYINPNDKVVPDLPD